MDKFVIQLPRCKSNLSSSLTKRKYDAVIHNNNEDGVQKTDHDEKIDKVSSTSSSPKYKHETGLKKFGKSSNGHKQVLQ